jgi:hypothetical protein
MALSLVVSSKLSDGYGALACGPGCFNSYIKVISIVAYDLPLRLVSQLRPEIRNHNRVITE